MYTSNTPSVQYGYSLMAGGANHSRLTGMIYPNGRTLTYNYNSGLDDAISRLSSISGETGTCAILFGTEFAQGFAGRFLEKSLQIALALF